MHTYFAIFIADVLNNIVYALVCLCLLTRKIQMPLIYGTLIFEGVRMKLKMKSIIICVVTTIALQAVISPAYAAGNLVIWWNKAYYPEEEQRLHDVISEWEKLSGVKVELDLMTTEDIPKKLVAALDAKQPPDIAFGHTLDLQYTPQWAYNGVLEDVSDIVLPIKRKWLPVVLDTVHLYNGQKKQLGYYGVPIEQQSVHLHYWVSMLKEAGLEESDIPKEWNAFWAFWCDPVQTRLRKKGQRVYGVGLTLSSVSVDTFMEINMFLNAYGVTFMDKNGKLQVADPAVRKGIARVLRDFTKPYQNGCSPSSVVNWKDSDNNLNFLNKLTVLTANPTLSIPASQYNENPDNYKNNMRTILWPNGPNGKPPAAMTAVKSALVFSDSKNKAAAKDFLKFLTRPENLGPFVEGALGRWFPVMTELVDTPYWKGTNDPHRAVEYKQYTEREVIPFQQVYNYKYAAVQAENLWGKALGRIVIDHWSAEKATDELISRMQELLK